MDLYINRSFFRNIAEDMDIHIKMDIIRQIQERKSAVRSKGENMVAWFLDKHNIRYITEYYFEDLLAPQTGLFLFYDFYISSLNTVIEVNGKYHFKPIYGERKFERVKKLDAVKREYCKKNKIKYIAIKTLNGKIDFNKLYSTLFSKELICHIGYSFKKSKKNISVKKKSKTKTAKK